MSLMKIYPATSYGSAHLHSARDTGGRCMIDSRGCRLKRYSSPLALLASKAPRTSAGQRVATYGDPDEG